jgi:murein DD-endopeptidase MepM/ murein hydrolase activator NlpD
VVAIPALAVLVTFTLILLVAMGPGGSSAASGVCAMPGRTATVPTGTKSVAGFSGDQLANAAAIMDAGADLGLPVAAQILGVQAAIGESTLKAVDHGDAAGPDSRGLFQQRAQGWGSYADRMDPHASATNFFTALRQVEGWQELEPTTAIHRTQRNADPDHYTQFRPQAAAVVTALSGTGTDQKGADALDANGTCPSGAGETIGALGSGSWVHPLPGSRLTSSFGARPCPAGTDCNENTANHKGIDFAKGDQSEVVAPVDMRITVAEQGQSWKSAYGTYVIAKQIDKPGLVFEFHHLAHGTLQVKAGDTVAAGTPLGSEGGTGNSSGVHLHFQIASPEAPANAPTFRYAIDPRPILKSKGVL